MIILFSFPEMVAEEVITTNRLLEQHPELIFHLRKPTWEQSQYSDLIESINPEFHPRIVIHQHHELVNNFALKGIHVTEKDRLSGKQDDHIISTSFHQLTAARKDQGAFHYFFCSPIFPSISKSGYATNEDWDISDEPIHFKEKAIALGGIETARFTEVLKRGFQHIAVLGTIWESENPEKALSEVFLRF